MPSFPVPEKPADWDQTPEEICQTIIGLVPWTEGELVLEPFRGDGNFYNKLPLMIRKDWCELKDGRDFFHYEGPRPDTIITNPPFRNEAGGDNLVVPCLERCLQLARKRVVFFINHKSFNSLTAARLKKYGDWGWGITHLSVWDTKKWFGRYYLTIWENNKPSIIGYFPSCEQETGNKMGLASGYHGIKEVTETSPERGRPKPEAPLLANAPIPVVYTPEDKYVEEAPGTI